MRFLFGLAAVLISASQASSPESILCDERDIETILKSPASSAQDVVKVLNRIQLFMDLDEEESRAVVSMRERLIRLEGLGAVKSELLDLYYQQTQEKRSVNPLAFSCPAEEIRSTLKNSRSDASDVIAILNCLQLDVESSQELLTLVVDVRSRLLRGPKHYDLTEIKNQLLVQYQTEIEKRHIAAEQKRLEKFYLTPGMKRLFLNKDMRVEKLDQMSGFIRETMVLNEENTDLFNETVATLDRAWKQAQEEAYQRNLGVGERIGLKEPIVPFSIRSEVKDNLVKIFNESTYKRISPIQAAADNGYIPPRVEPIEYDYFAI